MDNVASTIAQSLARVQIIENKVKIAVEEDIASISKRVD